MMTTQTTTTRDTFVSVGEILSEAARRCLEVEADLKVLAGHGSDPVSLAYEEIADSEHRLAVLLAEFASSGPQHVLDTRFQYTPDESAANRPRNAEDAVAQLVDVNHQLCESLRELSNNVAPPEVAEDIDKLQRQVDTMGRRISMISVTLRDG
jgi:hypothetical protein